MIARFLGALAVAGLIGAGSVLALQEQTTTPPPAEGAETTPPAAEEKAEAAPAEDAAQGEASKAPPPRELSKDPTTPMKDRVAVIGLLNKRNGLWRDLTLKPGQSIRVGDVIIRLRACEATAPWEPQKLTGAFVQTDVRGTDGQWRRVFSGWLYKESPSLNVVEHPIYDVWPKSCTMRHPDIGPETVLSSGLGGNRSSAKKSDEDSSAPVPPPVEMPSEASNNPT